MPHRPQRYAGSKIASLALVIGITLTLIATAACTKQDSSLSSSKVTNNITLLDSPRSLEEFDKYFSGTPHLVAFGFTQCPDICPMLMAKLVKIGQEIPADKLSIAFVSIDPTNDTEEALTSYITYFSPDGRIKGLRFDTAQLDSLAKRFYASIGKNPKSGELVHSTKLFLTNELGQFIGYINSDASNEQTIASLLGHPTTKKDQL